MNLIHRSLFVCLACFTFSLFALEPERPTQIPAVDPRIESQAAGFLALRQKLNTQEILPEQRIAAMDEWRRTNGSPLAGSRPESDASDASAVAASMARQRQAALSLSGTGDEKELAELQSEVATAVGEMRSYDVTSEKRIRMFDEFRRANRDVFQQIRTLRKAIAARRMENAPPTLPIRPSPRSEAEAALQDRMSAVVQEIEARRNASDRLAPEERIAAMDRDRALFKERADSLRA